MLWRRRPAEPDQPADEGTVSDAEIEAQLEAELAETGGTPRPTDEQPDMGRPAPGAELAATGEEPADGDLVAGIARSRGGFVARLKGLLGRGDPDAVTWDEVEETLIAGDVGGDQQLLDRIPVRSGGPAAKHAPQARHEAAPAALQTRR